MSGTLRPELVDPLLRGAFGRPYVWRDVCPSTQELARSLPHGGVAACEAQSAGRGRSGQTWESPHGRDVLFSLALEPRTAVEELPPFSLVAAEAVCEATLPSAVVQWPNDVMAGGRKLAGVLAELRGQTLVLGVGVNVNAGPGELPEETRIPATSLRLERGQPVDRAALLADILERLEERFRSFERDGFGGLERDGLRGRRITLGDGTTGVCRGVDDRGRLLLDGRALSSAEATGVTLA
ncbi:MAG TPA: biotin--[acetyl-CoA-carboxylase] ligase [Gaiellales bacterium]|nr:biotin--[acetyl-CoA-carboxylase] ligase [Gaiellales bacterium]